MTTICTGWHPAGWEQYAHRFAADFAKHWPDDVDLVAYVEEPISIPVGEIRSLWDCNGVREFIEANKGSPVRCGSAPTNGWRDKDHKRGYCFKYDAVKFCKQMFIPEHAASKLPDGEILAWFDADVVTHRKVPEGFIESLIGKADLCSLGRKTYHSEIGFWAVRLNDNTRSFLLSLAYLYRTNEVFKLAEWHSAFVFDHCLKKFEHIDGGRVKNLTPNGTGHVWFQSKLGVYTDHLKGDRRKIAGASPERK